ncbi:DUF6058 family natural product biosynthesis protein [Streptomyces sp. NPDC051940]|uniref:DUF6058 family natural product biosynthesis protein n=1 Tax=Streptomyces sp. NPDC051940 TaxID=3155675 RepID=UPI0034332899
MPTTDLRAAVTARYTEVNGEHPMTAADDAYVSAQFTVLEELCATRGRDAAEVRELMLAGRLPLPAYLRSDGAEMVPVDYFALADRAGGVDALRAWFTAHWADPARGAEEWEAYLSGRYVCLVSVTPTTIQRKDQLVAAIETTLATPAPQSPEWLRDLHALVDELHVLEPSFTQYDRLRFGGPTSRDRCITAVRERYPRRSSSPSGV